MTERPAERALGILAILAILAVVATTYGGFLRGDRGEPSNQAVVPREQVGTENAAHSKEVIRTRSAPDMERAEGSFPASIRLCPPGPDGAFSRSCRVLLRAHGSGLVKEVELQEQHWSGLLPLDAYSPVAVEGESASLEFSASETLSPVHPHLEITAWAGAPWAVDVRDALTGHPLVDVDIWTTAPHVKNPVGLLSSNPRTLPEADDDLIELARSARSPIALEVDRPAVFWVGSPGYIWGSFRRHGHNGDVRVDLVPAGSLEIEVSGTATTEALRRVELWLAPGTEWEQCLEASVGTLLQPESLPVGRHEVVARLPGLGGRGAVLAREFVLVERGLRRRVSIALHGSPVVGAEARVTVVLPEQGSRTQHAVLWLEKRGSAWLAFDERKVSTFHSLVSGRVFEEIYAGLEPGTYRVRLDPLGVETQVEMLAGLPSEVVLEIPDEVRTRVVCTGTPTEWLCLVWKYSDETERLNYVFRDSPGQQEFELVTLAKPILIKALGCSAASEWTAIGPDEEDRTMRIVLDEDQAVTLRLEVREGPARANLDRMDWEDIEIRADGHAGRLLSRVWGIGDDSVRYSGWGYPDYSRARLLLSAPGRYVLRFFDGPGDGDERALLEEAWIDVPQGHSHRVVELR